MEKGILEKTGKSIEHWISVVQDSKIEKHKVIMDYLISQFNLSYGHANFVALKAKKSDAASQDSEDLIQNQYVGKENLKPIYEKLLVEIKKIGEDISVVPKKDSVSFIRKKQFALIKPASKTRIDLGLKFKDKSFGIRLENSGPFGLMCTHRVQITSIEEVDQELIDWIKEAYEISN